MSSDSVNRLITNEVDNIEDSEVQQFIRSVLAHERRNIDKTNFSYKQKYKDLIKESTSSDGA